MPENEDEFKDLLNGLPDTERVARDGAPSVLERLEAQAIALKQLRGTMVEAFGVLENFDKALSAGDVNAAVRCTAKLAALAQVALMEGTEVLRPLC
jgi:hypothetical protein